MVTISGRVRIRNRGRITNSNQGSPPPPPEPLFLDSSVEGETYVGAVISSLLFQTAFQDSSIDHLLPQGGLISDYEELDPEEESEPLSPLVDMTSLDGFIAGWEADSTRMLAEYPSTDSWLETSGTFDALLAGTSTSNPAYVLDGGHGQPAITFDPANGHYFARVGAANMPISSTTGQTIYAVVRSEGPNTGTTFGTETIISQWNPESPARQYWLYRRVASDGAELSYNIATSGGATQIRSSPATFPAGPWMLITARWLAGTMSIQINGVNMASGTRTGTMLTSATSQELRIGSARGSVSRHWHGDMSAIYLYNEGHDDNTVAEVTTSLAGKFGITLS
jgi:hypothetical protein